MGACVCGGGGGGADGEQRKGATDAQAEEELTPAGPPLRTEGAECAEGQVLDPLTHTHTHTHTLTTESEFSICRRKSSRAERTTGESLVKTLISLFIKDTTAVL